MKNRHVLMLHMNNQHALVPHMNNRHALALRLNDRRLPREREVLLAPPRRAAS